MVPLLTIIYGEVIFPLGNDLSVVLQHLQRRGTFPTLKCCQEFALPQSSTSGFPTMGPSQKWVVYKGRFHENDLKWMIWWYHVVPPFMETFKSPKRGAPGWASSWFGQLSSPFSQQKSLVPPMVLPMSLIQIPRFPSLVCLKIHMFPQSLLSPCSIRASLGIPTSISCRTRTSEMYRSAARAFGW